MPEPEGKKPDAARRTDVNPFIGKVAPDPANPQPLVRLTGYRGASSEAGHTRLYLDANISGYVDIPDADVVHELPVPHEVDPLGAVSLWVKQNSKLNFHASKTTGGDPSMFGQYGMPAGQAAAPQNVGTTGFPTQPTLTQTLLLFSRLVSRRWIKTLLPLILTSSSILYLHFIFKSSK